MKTPQPFPDDGLPAAGPSREMSALLWTPPVRTRAGGGPPARRAGRLASWLGALLFAGFLLGLAAVWSYGLLEIFRLAAAPPPSTGPAAR